MHRCKNAAALSVLFGCWLGVPERVKYDIVGLFLFFLLDTLMMDRMPTTKLIRLWVHLMKAKVEVVMLAWMALVRGFT